MPIQKNEIVIQMCFLKGHITSRESRVMYVLLELFLL